MKGKHLVLVSTDVADDLRRGKAIALQSPDGRQYRATHTQAPSPAERVAYFERIGQGALGNGFKYVAADERSDVEQSGAGAVSVASTSTATSLHGVIPYEVTSPGVPSSPRRRAEAAAVAERELMIAERERMLASRERELAEREHIALVERDYERVYEERQRHYAAHPYYPRYERIDRVASRTARVVHSTSPTHGSDLVWEPRFEHRIVDRHPIVYTARPSRSISARGPARSASR